MRFACLDPAARAIIVVLLTVSASLWVFLGFAVDQLDLEDFDLTEGGAVTATLTLAAAVIGVVMRDGIRESLISHMRATRPAGEQPARPHLVPVPDEDAG
jgi:hypothetical protein